VYNIRGLGDLYNQDAIKYAPVMGSDAEMYFRKLAEFEAKIYDLYTASLNNKSFSPVEWASIFGDIDPKFNNAVPYSDKYTNMWRDMMDSMLPETFDAGVARVLNGSFALIGDAAMIKYAEMTNCRLMKVGNEFNRRPIAIGVQQGSQLKEVLSQAILQLLKERQLAKLTEKWWTNNPKRVMC